MFGLHINIKTLLLVMLMALPVTAFAQIAEYSARVVDARTGEPLVSATVAVASDKATVTNGDGVFSINADADDVLKISYIGYKCQLYKKIISLFLIHPTFSGLTF